MQKKLYVFAFLAVSLLVFSIGLNTLYSEDSEEPDVLLPAPVTATCQEVFGDKCTQQGQCSYNLTPLKKGTCKIYCRTKIVINGKETIIRSTANCGDPVPQQQEPQEPGTVGNTSPLLWWQ
jgi:hypothetical protein